MIKARKYNITPQLTSDQREFNRRYDRALSKARMENPFTLHNSADSFVVAGESKEYFVRFSVSDNEPYIHCNCKAGLHDFPCYHALTVLDAYKTTYAFTTFPMRVVDVLRSAKPSPSISLTLEKGQSFTAESKVKVTITSEN